MHSSPFRLPSGQALLPELAWIVLIWIGLCGAATSSLAASPAAANASSASSASSTRPGWWHLADPHFSRLPTENALPSNAITALAEDRYGFIWIGTQNGLARWDGYRLRNYQHDPANPHSLPSSFIQVLHLDAQGMLWAGSANGGLAWYNTRTDTFEPIPVGPGGSSHASILNMADDGQGGLLVITAGGLDQIVAERNGFKVKPLALFQLPGAPAPTTAPPLRLAPGEFALRLLHDRQDRIWLSTSLGLRLRDPQTGQFKLLPLQNPDSNPMPGKAPAPLFIISMHQASDGRIWLGTTMQGVFIFEPDKQQLTRLSQVGDNPALKQLQHDQISAILEVQPGEIWIATPPSGLLKMDVASRQIRWIKANPSLPGSLPNDTLCCMLRARSGQIWLGTQDSVSHYLPGAVHTLRANQALPDHLADPNMQAIRTMPDGRIFLGGVKHGLNTIDPAQQIIQRTRPGDLPTDWPYTVIRDISSPLDGKVLLGTDHGLFQTEPDGSRIRPLPLAKAGPEVSITSMLVQGDDVWLGSGFGLLHLNARTGLVPGKGQLIASLERQFISTMVPGQDHTLWLGTMNNGVFQYTPSSGKLRHIVPRPGSAQGLPSKIITSLLQDSRGWLWVSTLDAGISVNQAPQRDLFINLSTAQGLPHAVANKILEDNQGFVWVSTDYGLARIDPSSLKAEALGPADGVHLPVYFANAGSKTASGELLFSAGGGITALQPERYRRWQFEPKLVITRVQVGNRDMVASRFNLDQNVLDIPAAANSLAVEFAALDLSAPERNRYAYRLEGFDQDWIETDPGKRLASYTNLPPGSYRLHLRGANRNGDWSKHQALLQFKVQARWYQLLWVRLLGLLLLALLSTLAVQRLVRVRTGYLRQRQQELEREVAQRTSQLQQAQAQLVQQEKLASLGGVVSGIAHEINTPLGTALVALSGIARLWEQLASAYSKGNLSKSMLASATQEGHEFTTLALSSAQRAADLITIFKSVAVPIDAQAKELIELGQYLPEVAALIQPQLDQTASQLTFEIEPGLSIRVAQEPLFAALTRILANCPDHAFADGRSGVVQIKARGLTSEQGDAVEILIQDDGHGIASADLPRVFDPFFTTRSGSYGHIGLGLHVAYNHVTQGLQGRIHIVSTPGHGTAVSVIIPLRTELPD